MQSARDTGRTRDGLLSGLYGISVVDSRDVAIRSEFSQAQGCAGACATSCNVIVSGDDSWAHGNGQGSLGNRHSSSQWAFGGSVCFRQLRGDSGASFRKCFFGHVRGAFTGAMTDKAGYVSLADGGTLFLDELGELPLDIQAKRLRFVANGTYWPVGATTERRADVRILSATHRPIDTDHGYSFREDLFFRLSVILLRIPALETDDIRVISRSLAPEAMSRHGKRLSVRVLHDLRAACATREWTGGVRQLQNTIERFMILFDTELPTADGLEEALDGETGGSRSGVQLRGGNAEIANAVDDLLFLGHCARVRRRTRIGRTYGSHGSVRVSSIAKNRPAP